MKTEINQVANNELADTSGESNVVEFDIDETIEGLMERC